MATDNENKSIAARLKWAREQAGLSQGQVAKQLGVHRPTISQIESGDRKVRLDELDRFAEIYGVDRTWLMDGDSALPGERDPRIELAARELTKLKREDLDNILRLIQVLRDNEGVQVNSRTGLARQALRAAMQIRRNLPVPREAALNAFDVAKMSGIDIRFVDAPSLEGMFVRDPGLRILLPSLQHRPRARVLFSCAHEIGHQQLGHGTRADRYLDTAPSAPVSDEEFLADSFAGHLLMPRAAVMDALNRRNWLPDTMTPPQILLVAGELGVGYENAAYAHARCARTNSTSSTRSFEQSLAQVDQSRNFWT